MLRINSASVLFVPPFECAWLSELSIGEGGGCLSFEAKGTSVAMLLTAVRLWLLEDFLLQARRHHLGGKQLS